MGDDKRCIVSAPDSRASLATAAASWSSCVQERGFGLAGLLHPGVDLARPTPGSQFLKAIH